MESFHQNPAFAPEFAAGVHGDITVRLQALEVQAAELEQALASARDELEHVRRRAREDLARAGKFAIEGLARSLLPFKDSLETALRVDTQDVESVRTGIEMMLRQLQAALDGSGLTEIAPQVGEPFDPRRHRAIPAAADDNVEDRPSASVAALEQKGYLIGNRLIRPATVRLAE
jgi:molecular chaperone GrpE